MESAEANRIWRGTTVLPFHSAPPSDRFRKQSWLESNWFGRVEQNSQACTRPSRAEKLCRILWLFTALKAIRCDTRWVSNNVCRLSKFIWSVTVPTALERNSRAFLQPQWQQTNSRHWACINTNPGHTGFGVFCWSGNGHVFLAKMNLLILYKQGV